MASQIDATKPADGVNPVKSDYRQNLGFAKSEIEALQALDVAVRNALGIGASANIFPDLGGDNTPTGDQQLTAILLALDAAITAAAASSGGNPSLGDITDILSPTEAIRSAFQNPLSGTTQDQDFAFDLGSQGGRFITVDNSLQSVDCLLPATAALAARSDGYLCTLMPTSGSNFASITAPTDTLRFQQDREGELATQTVVFIGRSRTLGIRSAMHIFKDGPIYTLVGAGRLVETDNLADGAAESLPGTVLQALTLAATAFPTILDLGGTKQAGGARSIVRDVAGATTLTQADAGKIVRLTGAGNATWAVGDLSEGTVVEIKSKSGAGEVTINPTGVLAVDGGLTLASGSPGAIRFFNDEIEIVGTA